MKIGLVVDGVSEFAGLVELYPALRAVTGHEFVRPIKADIQPYAPIGVIARKCLASIRQHSSRGAQLVIVLLDREQRPECPGALASSIQRALARDVDEVDVAVVVKNRTFENWVVADIAALRRMQARFQVSGATERAVQPNKADHVDALLLLGRSVSRGSYDKVVDGKRVMRESDPLRIAAHSRSFRRFLRCAGAPAYGSQSQQPV